MQFGREVPLPRAFRPPLRLWLPATAKRKTEDRWAGKPADGSSNGGQRNTVPTGCGYVSWAKVRFPQFKPRTVINHALEPLDELSDMVSKLFADIPNRGVDPLPAVPDHPFGPNEKGVSQERHSFLDIAHFCNRPWWLYKQSCPSMPSRCHSHFRTNLQGGNISLEISWPISLGTRVLDHYIPISNKRAG